MADILTVQGVILTYTVIDRIITSGINVVEIGISFTDYRFPNKSLRGHDMSHLIRIICILRTPINIYLAGVTVLEDSTDEEFDLICGDCLVVG